MAQKGYISEFMNGGRIVSHGKIDDLSNGFKLPGDVPFSVYVRPKFSTSTLDTVLAVRCSQDEKPSEAPVPFNDWTPMAIVELAPDTEVLATNDIYWGSGCYVEARYDCVAFPVAVEAHTCVDCISPAQEEKSPAYEHAHIGDAHKERR